MKWKPLYYKGSIGDNGKENGNYYLGFRGLGPMIFDRVLATSLLVFLLVQDHFFCLRAKLPWRAG